MNSNGTVQVPSHSSSLRISDIAPSFATFYRILLILICLVIFWKLWRLPQTFAFIPYLGTGRLGTVIFLFLLINYRQMKIKYLPGKEKHFLILIGIVLSGCIFSFSIYVIESSFAVHYAKTLEMNSLIIKQFINDMPYLLMLLIIFNRYDDLMRLFNVFLIGIFVIMVLVTINLDSRLLAAVGSNLEYEMFYERIQDIVFSRLSFGTMNSNTYGGLLAGFFIIGIFMFLSEDKPKARFFYTIFVFLCAYHIISAAGRGNSLKMILSLVLFLFLVRRMLTKKLFLAILIIGFAIVFYLFISTTEGYWALISRWADIITRFGSYGSFSGSTLHIADNLDFRIAAAMESMPKNLQEWLIGTGGIQTGFVPGITYTTSHIELANWLSQFGLITFVPLMLLFVYLFVFFWRTNRSIVNEGFLISKIELLSALGMSLLVGLFIEMLNSPLFFGRWLWLGIIIAIVGVLERERAYIRKESLLS